MSVTRVDRRELLIAACAAAAFPAAAACQTRAGTFRPEAYGAKGDGRTDDTAAFGAMAAAVARARHHRGLGARHIEAAAEGRTLRADQRAALEHTAAAIAAGSAADSRAPT